MPTRTLRLRVGGLTLLVRAARPTRALDPPPEFRPFLAKRGGDIRLALRDQPVPEPASGSELFRSGGVWSVSRLGDGLLYSFRTRAASPPLYKGAALDAGLRRGVLYFPARRAPRYALDYPLDELLFQHRLAREGGLEVHACGVVVAGGAVLFCGRSGAGKSTTARVFRRVRPGAPILSDDRIVLRTSRRGPVAYGTPWHGDGGFATPGRAPLRALFFLRKARASGAVRLSPGAGAARLLARSFPPLWDRQALDRALETAARVAEVVPCFELRFRPDQTAIDAALRALAGS